MPIDIIVPRLGWSMEEGAFVAWLKKDGEQVKAGEALFSIEGDKAIQEIESIDSGILRIAVNAPKPGESIRVGDVLGCLVSADEAALESPPAVTAKAVTKVPSSETRAVVVPPAGSTAIRTENPAPARLARAISPRALRVAGELGVDWTIVSGTGRTGRIRERDIRAAGGSRTTMRPGAPEHPSSFASGREPAVLVTGGCGFIGTWVLRELLGRGLRAVVLDTGRRPERWQRVMGDGSEHIPLIQGSLLDRDLLARVFADHQVNRVIHLAALLTPACQADPWDGCRVNVLGSVALFEQVRACAQRLQGFSYASSVAVFGDEPGHASGAAPGENRPPTFYGAFKKALELVAEQYWRQFQIASVGIRPQVVYGPEREIGLTAGPSLAARAAARGEPYCIGYTGRVGYDYVEDVARAFVRGALETPPGAHVVDLPGDVADVNQVVAAIVAAVPGAASMLTVNGPPIPAHAPPDPRFIATLYPDWQTTPLVEGIRRTVDFYRVASRTVATSAPR
jgi:nucleoside-diphosphate-sugar epimerase